MNRSLTVFLCSTFSDLNAEREAVLDAVRKLQLQPDSMEFFGARTDLPLETCLEEVRKSDVLVVIVGYRYGSIVPEKNISFSEAEYDEGYRLEKPCLVYLRDENAPILPRNMEREPDKMRLLENFRATLSERHTVAKFESSAGLAVQVAADLSRTVQAIEDSLRAEEEKQPQEETLVLDDINSLVNDAMENGLTKKSIVSAIRQSLASLLSSEGHRRPLVFLSHSAKDKPIVREFSKGLKEAGIDVWFDEDEMKFGARIIDEIQRGLDSADFMIYFISKYSMSSRWSKIELDTMMYRRIEQKGRAVILPVRLDNAEVPALLRDVMYLDLTDGNVQKAVTRLVEAIKLHTTKPSTL